jgi:hypothetical protein
MIHPRSIDVRRVNVVQISDRYVVWTNRNAAARLDNWRRRSAARQLRGDRQMNDYEPLFTASPTCSKAEKYGI